ncbi:unnamed protein product [Brassicogethes aeneus]|uniref:Uncharacterized protein n=1 Tax=Brassicogethes aeneus TaxID=1431903 RepID=A0A9P0B5S2_BRAAE|nr:unnamed protein product [Brassicogethes aeneus]
MADDFEDELWGISENQDFKGFEPPPPPTISAWKAKMSKNNNGSIFDTVIDDNIVISGRGRGKPHFIIKPGDDHINNDYDYQEDEEIRRKIRETSGIGYSNSLIEEIHRNEVARLEIESPSSTSVDDTLRLRPSSAKTSRSSSPYCSTSCSISSVESSPRKTLNNGDVITSSGPIKNIKSYSALLNNLDDCGTSRPPPLSQMLKNGKLNHIKTSCDIGKENSGQIKKHSWGTRKRPVPPTIPKLTPSHNNSEYSAMKDVWDVKSQKKVETINIESHMEFPPL